MVGSCRDSISFESQWPRGEAALCSSTHGDARYDYPSSHAFEPIVATHTLVGSDLQLIDTAIQILSHLSLPTVVQTGRYMYKKHEQ